MTIPTTLTREEAFSFLAWLLWKRPTPDAYESLNRGISPTYELILRRFLAAYPSAPDDTAFHAIYERVARGADAERLSEFLLWLYTNGTQGSGLKESPQGASWAFARHVLELEAIRSAKPVRPKTAVLPNPWRGKVTPAQAQAAYARVELGERSDELRLVLESTIEDWRRRTRDAEYRASCPACSRVRINLLTPSRHLSECAAHPAHRRLRTVLVLAGAAALGGSSDQLDLTVPTIRDAHADADPYVYNETGPLRELQDAFSGASAPFKKRELATLLAEWTHLLDRASDPCPWCNAVVDDVYAMPSHLLECHAHPANRRAATLETALSATRGALELAQERTMFVEELRLLHEETEVYEGLQNWADGRAYSKPSREDSWQSAQWRAASALGYSAPRSGVIPSERSQHARAALQRLFGKTPRAASDPTNDADLLLLREVQATLRVYVAKHGRGVSCPACARRAVHPGRLHEHLVACRAHPANARARRAAAELLARGEATDLPEMARKAIEPLEPRDPMSDRTDKFADEALEKLERGVPMQSSSSLWLEDIINAWDAFESGAAACCPGCGEQHGLDGAAQHLMSCEALESARCAPVLEERLAVGPRAPWAARLRAEADENALALAYLVDANRAYWSAMSDGDRGTSIEAPEQVPMWKAARAAARHVVAKSATTVVRGLGDVRGLD